MFMKGEIFGQRIPKSITQSGASSFVALMVYTNIELALPRCCTKHLFMFSLKCHSVDHLNKLKSARCRQFVIDLITLHNFESSANNFMITSSPTACGMSLILIRKAMGPKTVPWGTLLSTFSISELT